MNPTVLKLGGSVITEKDRPETVDGERIDRVAAEIAAADGPLVVVHGGGSFGHHHAHEHGLTTTAGSHDVAAVLDTHGAMTTLNGVLRRALLDRGVPAVPVHPLSVGWRSVDGELSVPTGAVETLLGEGFVPVLHGDVIAHEGAGVTILSGDELVVELAVALGADRVGVCSTAPGVLDGAGRVIERIDSLSAVEDVLGGSEATDVTGGMAAKVRTLLALDAEASVFGVEGLSAFLDGEQSGTTVA